MSNAKHAASDYFYLFKAHIKALRGNKPTSVWNSDKSPHKGDVILIAGVYENWRFLSEIGDTLHDSGYRVHVVESIKRNRGSIHAETLKLKDYLDTQQIQSASIVGHSKGALLGLHYLLNHNDGGQVGKLIAIAAPFSGTNIGKFIRTRAAKELLPTSETIQAYTKAEDTKLPIVSLFPEYDNQILHPSGSNYGPAVNKQIPAKGHHSVLSSPHLHSEIIKALDG